VEKAKGYGDSMTMDRVITRKLQELQECIRQLRKLQAYSYEEIVDDLEKIWAIERGIQVSIQIIIDVGNYILASIGENQVEDYTNIFDKLGQHGVLPQEFALEIRGMAGFRNILVHRYTEVDLKRVYDVLQNRLDDFMKYIQYIESYLT
jgi:uncharacterized protein YutE (UPF0331/DUF86 family)